MSNIIATSITKHNFFLLRSYAPYGWVDQVENRRSQFKLPIYSSNFSFLPHRDLEM
jgi:hypothetical protein